ncbi:DUF1294 domain-containing protein [Planctomycetota bacterium]
MLKYDPKRYFFVIAIILTAAVSGLLRSMNLNALYAWLIGISIITFLSYGYDKRRALRNSSRIPELILHILALLGGSPGAFLGQFFFRHKTKKLRFKIVFLMIVLVQAGLGFCYWSYYKLKT